ncbi:hypothetical protein V5799_008301, partial [Amblyomma americanum]
MWQGVGVPSGYRADIDTCYSSVDTPETDSDAHTLHRRHCGIVHVNFCLREVRADEEYCSGSS